MTRVLAVALVSIISLPALADKPTAEQIKQSIEDLGDPRFPVRERASKLLWEAGADAEQPLREALKRDDAETLRRAKLLLDKFSWGIFPDTPVDIVKQINAFREGDRAARLQVVSNLMSMGKPGYSTLKRLTELETNAGDKHALLAQVALGAQRALPGLLAAGDMPAVSELLRRCLLAGTEDAFTNYAAFEALEGRLPEAIAEWRKNWSRTKSATSGTVLVHLLKAQGDFAAARPVAAAVSPALEEQLLWEANDWKALSAKFKADTSDAKDLASLGTRAAVQRLAGDHAAFDIAVAKLRKLGESDDRLEQRSAAEALLLVGRLDDALKVLRAKNGAPPLLFDVLFARLEFKAAFTVPAPEDKDERFRWELRRARGHSLLGERKAAIDIVDRLAAGLKEAGDESSGRDLFRTMVEMNLRDRADAAAARYLDLLGKQDIREGLVELIEPLFAEEPLAALVWWQYLRRKRPNDEPAAAMAQARRLIEGKPVAELDEWCSSLAQSSVEPGSPRFGDSSLPVPPAYASAVAQMNAGHESKALEYFGRAVSQSQESWIDVRCGDLLSARGQWKEAAAWYERASKHAPSDALPVFLRGAALAKLGEAGGRRLIYLAHRMPLGNEVERSRLARELQRRGYLDDARRLRDDLLRLGWYRYFHVGHDVHVAARHASRTGDFTTAAHLYDRAIVGSLRLAASFREAQAYMVIPQRATQARMQAALKSGRIDEALALARTAIRAMPGDFETAISIVTALDRAGRELEAAELFSGVWRRYESVCQEFPDCVLAHNSLAWFAAHCGRELDGALDHARTAVRLDPTNSGVLDTLAEVHFRRGEQQLSLATMRKCLELSPGRPYFVQQLARFTKGDRAAAVPNSDDK